MGENYVDDFFFVVVIVGEIVYLFCDFFGRNWWIFEKYMLKLIDKECVKMGFNDVKGFWVVY